MKYEEVTATRSGSPPRSCRTTTAASPASVTRNIRDGAMELFAAKAVILATGGNGQIYDPTTNALICTGDGIAMAYRIGAPLMDMEMIQYHPTTLAGPRPADHRGRPRRGRAPLQRPGRALHGEVRAQQDGAGLARRGLARRADRDQRGPRLPRRHRRARHHGRAAQAHPRGAARDRERGPRLRRRGHHPRADPHQAGQPLRDGRRARPTSTARRRSPASTPPASAPASRCTAATGSARTRLLDTLVFGRRSGEHAAQAVHGMGMPDPSRSSLQGRGAHDPGDRRTATAPAGASPSSRPSSARRWTSTWPSSATRTA